MVFDWDIRVFSLLKANSLTASPAVLSVCWPSGAIAGTGCKASCYYNTQRLLTAVVIIVQIGAQVIFDRWIRRKIKIKINIWL